MEPVLFCFDFVFVFVFFLKFAQCCSVCSLFEAKQALNGARGRLDPVHVITRTQWARSQIKAYHGKAK